MPRNNRTSNGRRTMTIHAPSKNLVVATTSSTRNVANAPTPLNPMLGCQPGPGRGHTVGNRFAAGRRRAARGKGAQHEDEGQRLECVLDLGWLTRWPKAEADQ